jgi:gamma-glutamyltranspeptidase/glutathione hydrolase
VARASRSTWSSASTALEVSEPGVALRQPDMSIGTIATSDPRASEAGADVLRSGGNAMDAAVTAAFTLLVLEPHACGLGGDAFVLLKRPGEPPTALDGSGAIPVALAEDAQREEFEAIPKTGPRTFTVPGAAGLFEEALHQHGTIGLTDALAPAHQFARVGFVVRESLAASAAKMAELLAQDPLLAVLYLASGRPVREGEVIRNDRLADALEVLSRCGAADMYSGGLADAIAERSSMVGGYLDSSDLRSYRVEPMIPQSIRFRGFDVWELPPPTQGVAVLRALSVLEEEGRFDPDAIIEAITEGMLLTGIDLRKGAGSVAAGGDTTYIAAIDGEGLGVSLITSIFSEFGSGVGVEALGGPLQNRASGTRVVGRPRAGKPPHTTIPAMVTRDGELSSVLGVVGGYMQPQGQIQVLVNLLAHGMGAQHAVDVPRLRVLAGGELAIEPHHELANRYPSAVGRDPGNGGFGGCQVVRKVGTTLSGGSDPRRGGCVVSVGE